MVQLQKSLTDSGSKALTRNTRTKRSFKNVATSGHAQEKTAAKPGYTISDLGTLGGTASVGNGINNKGWVTGEANLEGDKIGHAALWRRGAKILDLGTLGGLNSFVGFPVNDDRGLIVGTAETSTADPLGENFCGEGTTLICLGFLWQNGVMTPLPTLGGNNGQATGVNNRGQMVGFTETSTPDPSCPAPQVLAVKGVIWGPKRDEIHKLPPFPGDSLTAAVAINDEGRVVGCSGTCRGVAPVSPQSCVHATLWQSGSVTDLGSFGGVMNNYGTAINNRGQVVGQLDLPGDQNSHAFLWQEEALTDLGTLPGDFSSAAIGINNSGQVVGVSCDASGNCRAFLWENGVMTDLNTLVCPGTSLYLTIGNDINAKGEIAGEAYDPNSGDTPAFLAVPSNGKGHCEAGSFAGQKVTLPENVREQLQKRLGFGRFRKGPALLSRARD
jgi:probable HAF family extracellular repeat protein